MHKSYHSSANLSVRTAAFAKKSLMWMQSVQEWVEYGLLVFCHQQKKGGDERFFFIVEHVLEIKFANNCGLKKQAMTVCLKCVFEILGIVITKSHLPVHPKAHQQMVFYRCHCIYCITDSSTASVYSSSTRRFAALWLWSCEGRCSPWA